MTRFSSIDSLTSVDLFCGAGGIAEGFRQAGFNCLYGNDINPYAVQTFTANHPCSIADNRPIDEVDPLLLRKQLNHMRPSNAPFGWGGCVMDSIYERRVWSGGGSS
jgi:site-specific DNA-cytosine methylase